MSSKSFGKQLLGIVLLLGILSTIGYFWLRQHRNSAQEIIFHHIPADAVQLVLNLSALDDVLKSDKLLRVHDDDTIQHLSDFITSPLKMGIDVSVAPVGFMDPTDTSFHLVLHLLQPDRFIHWIETGPGSVLALQHDTLESVSRFTFSGSSTAFSIQDQLLLISMDQRVEGVRRFFEPKPTNNPVKQVESGDLVTVYVPRSIFHLPADTFHLRVSDSMFSFSNDITVEPITINNLVVDWNTHHPVGHHLSAVLGELWNIKSTHHSWLGGHWRAEITGVESYTVDYITYGFDDDFNRVEQRQQTTHFKPVLNLNYHPDSPEQFEQLVDHLSSNEFLQAQSLKIGPYSFDFMSDTNRFQVGTSNINTTYTYSNLELNVNFLVLKQWLDELELPKMTLDSSGINHLKYLQVLADDTTLRVDIQNDAQSPYHVLGIIREAIRLSGRRR